MQGGTACLLKLYLEAFQCCVTTNRKAQRFLRISEACFNLHAAIKHRGGVVHYYVPSWCVPTTSREPVWTERSAKLLYHASCMCRQG